MIHSLLPIILFTLVLLLDSISCLPFGGTWRQVGSDMNGKAMIDAFGSSVAMSSDGKTIAIGAPSNDKAINITESGHVRVYTLNTTSSNWVQIGSDINGEAAFDQSGNSVSLSADGKTIAIGAYLNDGNSTTNSGHVRVYSYNSISRIWTQVGLDINGQAADDQFGKAVSMSSDGRTIAIGAPFNDNTVGINAGHVRVYAMNSITGNWVQVGSDINGESLRDQSGFSVAMSGDGTTIAIGAPFNDNTRGSNAGHVRVHSNTSASGNWTQIGSDIDGEALGDASGNAVAISSDGKTIAIGAYINDGNASNSGHVRVYSLNATSSSWTQVGFDIDGGGFNDQSGYSVAMSSDGRTIAIGAPYNDNAGGTKAGQVRIFSINSSSGNWSQVGLDIIGNAQDDTSGFSVAISSDGYTLAIGAPSNDSPSGKDSGQVRVYKYELPPTKTPTKSPTKIPTRRPTRNPTKSPTKHPTKNPTKAPSKSPTKIPTKAPSKSPLKIPTWRPSNAPTKKPQKSQTNVPLQVTQPVPIAMPVQQAPLQVTQPVPIAMPVQQAPLQVTQPVPIAMPVQQAPLQVPVAASSSSCGIFGLNFFCPRRGECGFWRRLFHLHDC